MSTADDLIDAHRLATAPLIITYQITGSVSMTTTVTGDARNVASVAIVYGSATMWSVTLTQAQPTATLPMNLVLGSTTINKGAGFTLTIPTTSTTGMVMVDCTIVTPNNPQGTTFQAPIATWPLVSSS